MKKSGPLLPWEKGPDCVFGCTRPPHLSRSFMKRGNTYSVRYTYTAPSRQILPELGELQNQKGSPGAQDHGGKSKEKAPNRTIQRFLSGAPPGTRTLGPLIKRNQEAIFVQIDFYEDSQLYTCHRDFSGHSSLRPLHCLHPFASIVQLFNVQNMCRNVQRASRLEKARFLPFYESPISCSLDR